MKSTHTCVTKMRNKKNIFFIDQGKKIKTKQ